MPVTPGSRSRSREVVVCWHRRLPGVCRSSRPLTGTLLPKLGRDKPLTFLKRPDFGHFQQVVTGLRKLCPTGFPVVVRTCKVPSDIDGLTKRNSKRFVIHLARHLCQDAAVEVLIHEWAHCMAWNLLLDKAADDYAEGRLSRQDFERVSHNASFGVAYSEAWAAYSAEILPALK